MERLEIQHFIDGRLVDGGARFPLIYPATGETIGSVPEGGEAEVDAAVQAAQRAFPGWAGLPPSQRRATLHRFADAIQEHGEELGRLETLDVGRPIRENGPHYIQRIAANIRFFADFAVQVGSEAFPMENGYVNYVLRRPVGVAALITPWNIPTMLETWKLGPALAFGNTVVLKPAEWTPVGAWKLAQLASQAGLPPGVFNVVHGFGPNSAGEYLTRHPGVRLISFTGEIATGKAIMAAGAPTLKRVSFELGGNGANIVFADAGWERALAVSLRAAFFNQGELCLAGARIFVEEPVYQRFVEDFAARAAALKVGDPMDPDTEMGALITREHMERVLDYVESARRDGARIVTGGEPLSLPGPLAGGNFMQPTVIVDCALDSRVFCEEVFGPVITVTPFRSEDEVIAWANGTEYGLSAVLQTTNLSRAHRLAARLEVGTVWVNDFFVRDLRAPFGGMKQSGIGREGGHYSLEFFTEATNVCIAV